MKSLTAICLIASTLLIQGCAKKQIEYIYIDKKIPEMLLKPEIVEFRSIKTQTDTAILVLDLYEALEGCNLKLEKIKDLNE